MTELGTHNTKGILIDTTKVTMLQVMGIFRGSNESLRSQGVVNPLSKCRSSQATHLFDDNAAETVADEYNWS